MPYIKQFQRDNLETYSYQGGDPDAAKDPGELNYLLTQACLNYMQHKATSYQYYNDVVGALEACKLEFYRRAVAPYEEEKIKANGDVYV
jgi:hypothetical protein